MARKTHIAIFGGNGYLGRHIISVCCKDGYSCNSFDIQEKSIINGIDYYKCDITDKSFWDSFDSTKYTDIIFLAGLSGVEKSFKIPESFIQINVLGLINLLEKVKEFGKNAPRIIFPSSRLVYEGGGIANENSIRRSRSVYGATKIACEELLSAYNIRYDIPYVSIRICVPYGNLLSKDYSYGTIGFFMSKIMNGEPITVYGDGSNCKTYTYIGDICEIIEKVIKGYCPSGIYNIGGYDYSLKEVAELIIKRFGGRYDLIPWPDEAKRVEMGNISLDATKLNKFIPINYKKLEDFIGEI